jgi:PAS domain S-box-containing protein
MPLSPAAPPQASNEVQPLQLLVDAISDYAIYMLDPDGAVVSWNSGAQRIQGYEQGEIVGQHFSRFFTPEDRANGLPGRILQEARQTGRSETEAWRLRKDGSRYLATSVVQPVRDGAGQMLGFAEITRDITERRAAQEALLESERRFRLLVEGVVDYAIYMLDPSGLVVNWNAGAQRLKGYSADEIVGKHFSRFYTREDRATGLPTRMLDLAAREGRYDDEGWRVRKDGSRFWASVVFDAIRNEEGELVGFAKVTRDITERQAAQEALQESERQFRMLVESVVDYALFTLDPNGIVTNWNSAPSASRAMRPRRSWGSTSRDSIPKAIVRPACRPVRCARPPNTAGSTRKAGGCARTEPCFGPASSSIGSMMKRASWSASPRSLATSRSSARRGWRSSGRRPNAITRRRWRRSDSSPAAWRTISTIC